MSALNRTLPQKLCVTTLFLCVIKSMAILPYVQTIKQYLDYLLQNPWSSQKCLVSLSMQQVQEGSHRFPPILKSERNGNSHIFQGFQFHPPENKDSWMNRRSLEGSWVCILFETSRADPELAMVMELSGRLSAHLHVMGWFNCPRLRDI